MPEQRRNVAIIGGGYVGLVTAAALAHLGHRVVCVDNDSARIDALNRGDIPIYEPGLDVMMAPLRASGALRFDTNLQDAVRVSQIVFICVGTPMSDSGAADMAYVEEVARAIGNAMDGSYRVIVNKSTVPVGSVDFVTRTVLESANGAAHGFAPDFDVVSNPEFLREGTAIPDTFYPNRIVIGTRSERAGQEMEALYAAIIEGRFEVPGMPAPSTHRLPVPVVVTDPASAELIKYAANSFLALKISFINEIAAISERVGADITQVAKGVGYDPRIGSQFLKAGLGWGGSCFKKDLSALRYVSQQHGYHPQMLDAAMRVNESIRAAVIWKLENELETLEGKTVALLGLAFKPNTDDLRDAPSLVIAERLQAAGATVRAFDPAAMSRAAQANPDIVMAEDAYDAAKDADAAVLVTEWPAFRALDLERLRLVMRTPVFLDGRNLFDPARMTAAGFRYLAFGR